MKRITTLLVLVCLFSCGNDANKLIVNGTVKGLEKGTVYLKKIQDTLLVTLDSVSLNGNSSFTLKSEITEPEMHFLYLNKNTKEDDRISFFADKGITEINTTLKNFAFDAKIKGSKQQEVMEEYLEMIGKFNDQNLDFTKDLFDAAKDKDSLKIAQTENKINSMPKRIYRYAVNFAINNKDSEVAPYIALSEIYDANITLLDTINNSLTTEIKDSKYGKALEKYISEIKNNEN